MRKELSLLASGVLLGGMLTSAPDSRAQSCEPSVGMEPGRVVNGVANLRALPTTRSETIEVMDRESVIFIGEESEGERAVVNGVASNVWREVFLSDTCESGFVWSGLVSEVGAENRGYDSLVFQDCPYYFVPGNINWMTFGYQEVSNPDEVMAWLGSWQGRSLWRGYDDPNPLGIPSDARRIGSLRIELKMNEIPGHMLYDDLTAIWFHESDSNEDEVYVFPFQSWTTFTDANGNHEGAHLCGDHAIPRWQYEELVRLLGRD